MKKVLIVSYHAPPREVTTAYRIEALIWNLPKFGWQPIICSGPPFSFTLAKMMKLNTQTNLMSQLSQIKSLLGITSEKSWLDKLISLYGEFMFYPDPYKGWAKTMSASLDYRQHKPDLIMSHSFPHTSHLVASRLVQETNHEVPWIASFSDLWTQSHFYPYSRYRKHFEEKLEARTLAAADCFVTVSPSLSYALEKKHGKAAHTIFNSYPMTPDVSLTNEFSLTYTGNFYAGKYDLELFCWAIAQYKLRWPKLHIHFYGQEYPHLVALAQEYNLPCTFHGKVSHHDSLIAQKQSQTLLHFVWNDNKSSGIYSAKLFEYLGAKRPIIAFGGTDDTIQDILAKTKAGIWCRTPDDLAKTIDMMYWGFEHNGATEYIGDPTEVSKYSVLSMVKQHASLFDRVVEQCS